jgi:hypothetical protein
MVFSWESESNQQNELLQFGQQLGKDFCEIIDHFMVYWVSVFPTPRPTDDSEFLDCWKMKLFKQSHLHPHH